MELQESRDRAEPMEESVDATGGPSQTAPVILSSGSLGVDKVQTAEGGCGCSGAAEANPNGSGPAPRTYIYTMGSIEPRLPTVSIEKEFAQVTGRADTAGLTDRQALQRVLSERRSRYLVRQLCWVLTIGGMETYLLSPRDAADFDLLVESLRPAPRASDLDVVIGARGPIAPPQLCNGLQVPIVGFTQLYSFDVESFIRSIPRPEAIPEQQFTPVAEEVFGRIMQMTDNAGATDEHRALNYLATRYPAIYATTAEAHARNSALTAIDVRPSPLSGVRKVVDVIVSYTNRQTDVVEKFFVRVDVTEEFPFLVTRISPYYDR
jgi:PatG C-terminal